jgi:hypothetical protein
MLLSPELSSHPPITLCQGVLLPRIWVLTAADVDPKSATMAAVHVVAPKFATMAVRDHAATNSAHDHPYEGLSAYESHVCAAVLHNSTSRD